MLLWPSSHRFLSLGRLARDRLPFAGGPTRSQSSDSTSPLLKSVKRIRKAETQSQAKIRLKSESESKVNAECKTKSGAKAKVNLRTKATAEKRPHRKPAQEESQLSTVAKGTAFEHRTLHLLRTAFAMSQLERTGGAGDRGVDLTGWWYPPPPPPPSTSRSAGNRARVRVLVQCKYQASAPLGPVHMRELEGTMYRKGFEARMFGNEDDDNRDSQEIQKDEGKIYRVPLLGILTSSTGFSSACARYSLASPFPLLLLHIPFSSSQQQQSAATTTAQGATPSFTVLPNRAFVASAGLMEGRLEFRSTRRISTGSEDGADEDAEPEADTDDMDSDKLALNTIDSPEILLDGRPLREHLSST